MAARLGRRSPVPARVRRRFGTAAPSTPTSGDALLDLAGTGDVSSATSATASLDLSATNSAVGSGGVARTGTASLSLTAFPSTRAHTFDGGSEGATVSTSESGALYPPQLVSASGTSTIQYRAASAYSGAFGATLAASGAEIVRVNYKLGPAPTMTSGLGSFYFRVNTALPSATVAIANFRAPDVTGLGLLSLNSSGQLLITDSAFTVRGTTTATLSVGTWYRLVFSIDRGASNATGTLALDLRNATTDAIIESLSHTTSNTGFSLYPGFESFEFGKASGSTTFNASFDQVYVTSQNAAGLTVAGAPTGSASLSLSAANSGVGARTPSGSSSLSLSAATVTRGVVASIDPDALIEDWADLAAWDQSGGTTPPVLSGGQMTLANEADFYVEIDYGVFIDRRPGVIAFRLSNLGDEATVGVFSAILVTPSSTPQDVVTLEVTSARATASSTANVGSTWNHSASLLYVEFIQDGTTTTVRAGPDGATWPLSLAATDINDSAREFRLVGDFNDTLPDYYTVGQINIPDAGRTGTASLSLSAANSAVGAGRTGTGSLSLTGTGVHSSGSTTASLSLTGTGVHSSRSTTASLSVSAANSAVGVGRTGTASLAVSATGAGRGASVGSASLSLSGTGVQSSVGTASLSLSATGLARAAVTGSASLTLSATGSADLPAPTGLTVTPVGADLLLDWNDFAGAVFYQIERSGTIVATSAVSTYLDTGLTAATQYCYRVRAVV